MERELQVGEAVRVTEANRTRGAAPGETGRVVSVSRRSGSREIAFYHCAMDRPRKRGTVAFYPDEVERFGKDGSGGAAEHGPAAGPLEQDRGGLVRQGQ
jgi:hypothetical protein